MIKRLLSPLVRFCALSTLVLLCLALVVPLFNPGTSAQSSGPRIWLQDRTPLAVNYVGPGAPVGVTAAAQPVAMAEGDFDHDGVNDLAVGSSTVGGGFIAVHRGNLDAFAPQSNASFQAIAHGQFPAPFLPEAKIFSVPVSPDFLAAGNFSGQGNTDLVVASRGGNALYVLAGDGKGNFGAPQLVNLSGGVTALAAGAFGNTYQPTLIVGLSGPQRNTFSLSVYGRTPQGLKPLGSYSLNAPASNILFGQFGDPGPDAAFLSGGKVSILRAPSMTVETLSLPVSARAMALGAFIYSRKPGVQIALLASDGSIQIVVRNEFDPRPYTADELAAIRRAGLRGHGNPLLPLPSFPVNGWKVAESFPAVGTGDSGQLPAFFRTRVSNNGADDIMWLNASSGQMVVISHPNVQPGASTFLPGQVSIRPYTGTPAAGMPMRVNVDGRPGVIALHRGETTPSVMMPIPDPTFTVNRFDDPTPASPIANACNGVANDCSLREAILRANGDTVMVPAGTYTLTRAKVPGDYSGQNGALYVNNTVTIVGEDQNTTIIQAGTDNTNGVDLVMAVNQDISPTTTNATASISNLTLRFGFNRGDTGTGDGWGGAIEFDTGTSGTANLVLTNVTLTDNTLTDGEGGGIAIFDFLHPLSGGSATLSNCIIQNNSAVEVAGAGNGGGVFVGAPAFMTMNNCQVINNTATQVNGASKGFGGGLEILGQAGSPQTAIHGSIITGNQAARDGGGIHNESTLRIDQGTIIANNSSSTDGGGFWHNASDPSSLSKVTITGNTANASSGNGGGIFVNGSAGGALDMSFSRIAGNTAHTGSNLATQAAGGPVTAQNNWWGTNSPAGTIGGGATVNCPTPGAGQICFDPWIALSHTASPNTINLGDSTTLTASFLQDNHGASIAASNLDVLLGLPITFNNAINGNLSNPEGVIQPVNTPVNIASTTESGSTVTVTTTAAHGFAVGEGVVIANVGVAGYNGAFTITGTPSATTFTYTNATGGLADSGGGSATIGPAGTATATFTGTIGGTGHADAVVDNGTATADITIVAVPPAITKTFGASIIPLNGTTSLTFTINNGNADAALDGVAFTDLLPAGLLVATPGNLNSNCSGTATAADGSGSVSLANASLAANTSCTLSVNVTGTTPGVKNNSVQITSSNAGTGNTSNASIVVAAPPVIIKAFGAAAIPLNGSTSLQFTIQNNNATPLTGVAFSDTLPAGLIVSTPNGLTGNTCGATPTAQQGTSVISLSGATVAASSSCTFSVNVTGTTGGQKNNTTGQVTSTEGGTGGTASASIKVEAPPSIAKVFNPASISLNATASLTFTITNPAANVDALTGVAFSDTLPIGLTVANASATVCGGTLTTTAPTGIALTGATIAVSSQCQFSVTVTGAASGQYINTTGAVTSTNGGTGNTATANLTVASPPTITKLFGSSTIPLGGITSLTFNIQNPNTNVTLNGLAFTDNLPAGLTVASTPNLSNTCGGTATAVGGSGSVSLSGGTLAASASCTLTVNVAGTTPGVKNNSVQVTSTEGGAGNTSNASITVVLPPLIGKAFGAPNIDINTTTSLTFTISNPNSTTTLTGIQFTDILPTGLTVPDGTTAGCGVTVATSSPHTISMSGATLAPSAQCSFLVTVTGAQDGVWTNITGLVTSLEGGNGNTATAVLGVGPQPTFTKKFATSTVPLNGTVKLTFTILNPTTNSTTLTNLAFTDTLPAGRGRPAGLQIANPSNLTTDCDTVANDVSTAGTVTLNTGVTPNTISLSGLGLNTGTAGCTISVDIEGIEAGDQKNTTTISSTEGGTPGPTATDTVSVVAPPSIAKVFNPPVIPLNATTSLTFTITNPGVNTADLAGVGFTDTLPTGLTVANASATVCGGTLTTTAPTGIALSGATISVNSQCQFSVTVTGAAAGQYTNTTGNVTSTNGGDGNAASANLTVAAAPTIAKSFGASTIPFNGTTSLTFNITNPNPAIALTGLAFTDSFPAGIVVATTPNANNTCGGTATAIGGAGTLSLSGGTLAASASCTVSVDVQGSTPGVKNNSVQVTSTEGGTGNTSNASITVVGPPVIIKAFGAASVPLNGSTSLQFTIQNNNTTAGLNGVAFTDTLPAGLVVATPNGLTGSCGGGTITATQSTNVVSLSGASLAASSSCTFSVNVTGTAAGQQNNTTGNVTSTEGGTGGTASASLKVDAPPSIAKVFNPAAIALNATTTLTFTITNPAANADALAGVAFTDTLPAGLVVATPNALTNNCGGTATATAGSTSISLSGGSIATPGSACKVAVNVTATATGQYTNTTGAVTSTNGGTGNTATANLTVAAPPKITKSFQAAVAGQGGTVFVNFVINNPAANSVPLTGIAFTDNLPAGLVVASPNSLSSDCGGTVSAAPNSSSISLSGGTVAANASCSIFVNLLVTTGGTKVNTTGPVSSTESGPGAPSNTVSLDVIQAPTMTKAFGGPTVPLLGTTSLTVTLTNPNSITELVNIGMVDALPAGLIVATPNGLTGTCITNNGAAVIANPGDQSVTLAALNLFAGTSCSFTVNVTGTTGGVKNNVTGHVTATFDDGTGTFIAVTGGTASASVTVLSPDMTIAKSHTGNFTQGDAGDTYNITVSNSGGAPTNGPVTVTDTVPPFLIATAIGGTGWSCTLGTLTCTRSDSLANGSSYPPITVTVSVAINAPPSVTNTASVSGGSETNTANNTASDPTTINQLPGPPLTITLLVPFTQTIKSGNSASFVFDVVSHSATLGNISFACQGLPSGAACSFTPSSENQGEATVTMTMTTTANTSSLPFGMGRNGPVYAALLFPVAGLLSLAATGRRNKKSRLRMLMLLGGLLVLMALFGCGGTPHNGTPIGAHPITVTATSAANPTVNASTQVVVTVQ